MARAGSWLARAARSPRPAVALTLSIALGGCGMLPWLGGEKDPHPPTELAKQFQPRIDVRILWKASVGKGSGERRLGLAPALANDRIFAADARGRLAALAAADGRVLWQRDTRLRFSGGPEAVGEQVLIGTSNGELVALNASDGAERWRARLGGEILSAPRVSGDLVVVHSVDDSVHGLALADGEPRWRYTHPAPVLTLHGSSSPVIAGDTAIIGIAGGKLISLELERGAPFWELTITPPSGRSDLERIADIDADPVVVDDTVYVATYNGDLAAVDIPTGTILWRRDLSAHAGLAVAEAMLYIADSEDRLWSATRADGAGQWMQDQLRYRRLGAPAIDGDALVVGDIEGWVHWVSRADGQLLARERVAKARIAHRPLVAGGRVFVQADDGTLAALARSSAPPPTSRAATPKPPAS